MTSVFRTRPGADAISLFAALAVLSFGVFPAAAQASVRFDVYAAPLFALSGDGLAPVLPHGGLTTGAGAELRAGEWIPARVQLGYFHIFPSAISSAGDLYRSWSGWALSLAAGGGVLTRESGRPFALDLLGGVSFGAARYPGTTVAFASFSVDLQARADFAEPGSGGLRLLLPLSYVWRPGARSFTMGLGAGWGFPARSRIGTAASGGGE